MITILYCYTIPHCWLPCFTTFHRSLTRSPQARHHLVGQWLDLDGAGSEPTNHGVAKNRRMMMAFKILGKNIYILVDSGMIFSKWQWVSIWGYLG